MTHPGDALRRLAARFLSAESMARVVDPAVADLQHEYAKTAEANRHRLRLRVLTRGYASLLLAVSAQALLDIWMAVRAASPEDLRTSRQVVTTSAVLLLSVTLIFVGPTMFSIGRGLPTDLRWMAMALIPQGLPVAIPVALTLGILAQLRRPVSVPLAASVMAIALVAASLSFGVMAWGMPVANRTFRVAAAGDVTPTARNPVRNGVSELTISELAQRIADESGTARRAEAFADGLPVVGGNVRPTGESRARNGLSELTVRDLARRHVEVSGGALRATEFAYHQRFALPLAPMVLSLVALFVVPLGTGVLTLRVARGAIACGVYYAVLAAAEYGARAGMIGGSAGAWMPNVVSLLIVGATVLTAHQRHRHLAGV